MSGQIRPLWPSIFQIAPRAGCEQIHVMIRSGVRSDSLVPTFPLSADISTQFDGCDCWTSGKGCSTGVFDYESEALSLVWL